ncbi:MAG: FadR/GntR family transcriptional regulator [Eubacteriales bacterium]|nr:FadR/GntR family transcriptional regulator [Eubacteriales bacterium]
MNNTAPFKIVKAKLSDQIADTLEQMILNEELTDHEKLMTEQELADQFAVSKTAVREALNILKERGLIETKNGMGNYITKPKVRNLSDMINRMILMENIDYREIYGTRIILETAACNSAAQKITPEALERLQQLTLQLERIDLPIETRRELDLDFHALIAESSGNHLLAVLINAIRNICYDNMFLEHDIENEMSIRQSIYFHRRILTGLQNHDILQAEEGMRAHLTCSLKNAERILKQDSEKQ